MMRALMAMTMALLALWCVPQLAWAQARDPVAAEALFQKGRSALAEQDYELACTMFEESFSLDPAVGTMMNLAACEEQLGHLAQAWERWHQAIDLLEPDDSRMGYAVMQAESLESRLAHLTIILEKSAPPGLAVYRDDVALGAASLGQKLPVDLGTHEVLVKCPGFETRRYMISLESGEHQELIVAPGAKLAATGAESGIFSRKSRQRTGFAALGLGAVGLGLAITTGALLPAQDAKVEENCPGKVCNEAGTQAISGAKTLLTLNTIGWVTAGVGAVSGATLLLTLPKKPSSSVDTAESNASANREQHARQSVSQDAPVWAIAVLGNGVQVIGSF